MSKRILWVSLFAITFAFVEASVVVYLRSLYYPEGFSFPLKIIPPHHLSVELARELSTIIMLVAVGILAGTTRWQKFAYFMVAFGVWDIFYYVWLKTTLDWPSSVSDWDVLFLIPIPWIGPVIAPLAISLLLIGAGVMILRIESAGVAFRPPPIAWVFSLIGTVICLYTFMQDTDASLRQVTPKPYPYWLIGVGVASYLVAIVLSAKEFRKVEQAARE
ncbi:MAG TPA: hypothetical protein VNN76_12290 [Bacteroidota bacterium]|nr:hypothetical protein [Bacteroidota bacterium]